MRVELLGWAASVALVDKAIAEIVYGTVGSTGSERFLCTVRSNVARSKVERVEERSTGRKLRYV